MPRPLNWIRGEGTTKNQRGLGTIYVSATPLNAFEAAQSNPDTALADQINLAVASENNFWSYPVLNEMLGSQAPVVVNPNGTNTKPLPTWVLPVALGAVALLFLKR